MLLRRRFALILVLLLAAPAFAAPSREVHDMTWRVHQCLIDADGLPFYDSLLADRLAGD